MKKLNKYLCLFATIAVLLATLVSSVIQKFNPIFLQKSVYFCEHAFRNISLQIPSSIESIVALLLITFLSFSVFKTITLIFQSITLKKMLTSQRIGNTTLTHLEKKLFLKEKIIVVEHTQPFAFSFGIRHPKIYISTGTIGLMNDKELETILLHEKYHLEKNDSFTLVLATIMQLFFPFFPLLSDVVNNYKIQREISADKRAIEYMGRDTELISVLKKLLQTPTKEFAFVAAIADAETLAPRITALTKRIKPRWEFNILKFSVSLVSITLLATALISPVQAVQIQTGKMSTTMVCLHNSDCMNWCKTHNTVTPDASTEMNMQQASYPYSHAR